MNEEDDLLRELVRVSRRIECRETYLRLVGRALWIHLGACILMVGALVASQNEKTERAWPWIYGAGVLLWIEATRRMRRARRFLP